MQELRNKFQAGQAFLALSDYQIACVLLKVIADRSANTNPISTKFLSVGELENIYDSVSLPAAAQQQIDYKLMEAYQWLLSEGYIMPAPEQPAGVVTVTSKGRLGLPPESNVENRPLIEWAGGARVTLAIVFTDIVDSTALGIEFGDAAMREVRREHFAQSAMLIAKQAGREIKTIGDSVMAVFHSVEAAFDYAHALHLHPGHEALEASGVHAGIHIGPVDVLENNIDGTEVAFAHRVVEAIPGAEIWLSNRAKEDIDRAGTHRKKNWQWQPHDVPLKGFGEQQRLWSLVSKPTSTETEPDPARPAVVASAAKFQGAEYRDGEARFRTADEPIGVSEDEKRIFLPSGAAMWLRVMPATDPGKIWAPHELKKHVFQSKTSDLTPFAFSFVSTSHDLHFLRARDGIWCIFCSRNARDGALWLLLFEQAKSGASIPLCWRPVRTIFPSLRLQRPTLNTFTVTPASYRTSE
jgi:class 3 adenylate cyclase